MDSNNTLLTPSDLDWNLIDTVLLDMDGTILDLHFDNYFWLSYLPLVYADKHALTLEQSKEILYQKFNAIRGTLNWYCLDYWTSELQLDIVGLKRAMADKIAFRPQAVEFLTFLQKQNKQVYLLTNAHPKSLEIKLLNTQFHQYFNELYSSHQFGAPKEEQVFWQKAQATIQFDKFRSLFIDDSETILKSARQFGIAYCLGISQPDSQNHPVSYNEFTGVENFLEWIN